MELTFETKEQTQISNQYIAQIFEIGVLLYLTACFVKGCVRKHNKLVLVFNI